MELQYNVAYRLWALADRANTISDQHRVTQKDGSVKNQSRPALNGWGILFHLDADRWDSHALYMEILRMMQLVHDQADLLAASMEDRYSPDLYVPAVESIQNAVRPQLIQAP